MLRCGDSAEWEACLRRFPEADAYYLAAYHRAHEANGDGEARAFVARNGEDLLFHPFLQRAIPADAFERPEAGWSDLQTVYGYAGPLATTSDGRFLTDAWLRFFAWCREHAVVAEFVRFHPLLGTHRFAGEGCRVVLDRETVVLPLGNAEEELWSAYPSTQRNMVRKARAKGVVCEEEPTSAGLGVFRSLYADAMDRLSAEAYYRFSDAYFEALREGLGERLRLFVARADDKAAAAALVLAHGPGLHYHLAAGDPGQRALAPNNLLLHAIATWGVARGLRWLHLGGGRTPDPGDSLFKFKAGVSRGRAPFHLGFRIHDDAAYERLCSVWMRRKGLRERPPFFLAYRLP
ncbi:MAG: GNAT family N-acetyltransferase [Planctomycetes bacterium]|nr:GNAT family N-acetyltransferase [Planctomycetota bacterium]